MYIFCFLFLFVGSVKKALDLQKEKEKNNDTVQTIPTMEYNRVVYLKGKKNLFDYRDILSLDSSL